MLSPAQQAYIIETGMMKPDVLARCLEQDKPEKPLNSKLGGVLDQYFRNLYTAGFEGKHEEVRTIIRQIAFLTKLPLDLKISYDHLDRLNGIKLSLCEMIIQELFLEGARLSEEVLNVKIDGHEPEICDMIDHWVKTQWSVYETAYISDTIWQEIKTVKDLENTDLINRFNGAAWEFKPANDLYWQAARSGEFSRILDVYAANDQAFPFEKLYVEKTEDGICLLDLINFNGEPDIHAKILDPELWQGQTDQLSDFWHNHLPEAIKAAHPFEGLTQKIYGVTAKDHYKIKKRQPLKR